MDDGCIPRDLDRYECSNCGRNWGARKYDKRPLRNHKRMGQRNLTVSFVEIHAPALAVFRSPELKITKNQWQRDQKESTSFISMRSMLFALASRDKRRCI